MGKTRSSFLCRFFRPTSDVNISKTVFPNYLKNKVQRAKFPRYWRRKLSYRVKIGYFSLNLLLKIDLLACWSILFVLTKMMWMMILMMELQVFLTSEGWLYLGTWSSSIEEFVGLTEEIFVGELECQDF